MSIMQKILGVAFAVMLMAGCSSQQSSEDENASANGGSGADGLNGADTRGIGSGSGDWVLFLINTAMWCILNLTAPTFSQLLKKC